MRFTGGDSYLPILRADRPVWRSIVDCLRKAFQHQNIAGDQTYRQNAASRSIPKKLLTEPQVEYIVYCRTNAKKYLLSTANLLAKYTLKTIISLFQIITVVELEARYFCACHGFFLKLCRKQEQLA